MKEKFEIAQLSQQKKGAYDLTFLNAASAAKVRKFHQSFPVYKETPLAKMKNSAEMLKLKNIYVKDESYRFGLNAFKVLGGSFAMGNYIAAKLHMDIAELPYGRMVSDEIRDRIGELTFVTATDGNHGRGVAWTANQLRQKSVVYMPKGSSAERLANIRAEGADASITELNYDEAVRLANEKAEKNGWIMVQDTAWDGYEDIPRWIIQGYVTMALEAYEQLPERPTHIFIQAGVGSVAAAVSGFFSTVYEGKKPIITVVEPNAANCIFRTAQADDSRLHIVTGEMNTMMAGLACGEPCSIGWEILAECADFFLSCPDYISAKGMRMLGNPIPGDDRVISGESGAVTFGCAAELMTNPAHEGLRKKLQLDENSVILCFSTEGATDKENYRSVVWDGKGTSFWEINR